MNKNKNIEKLKKIKTKEYMINMTDEKKQKYREAKKNYKITDE